MKQTFNHLSTRLNEYPAVVVFFFFLLSILFFDVVTPVKESSELENKTLQQRPEISISALVSNSWTAKYGDFVKDQFVLRDTWINIQSRVEAALLRKQEINGIFIGKDNMQFTRLFSLKDNELSLLERNIQSVEKFAKDHPGQVTFLLAPSASLIYQDKMPAFAPQINENEYLNDIFSRTGTVANVLDLRDVFQNSRDEYLYYRTDHHWTTQGAYLAYTQFCQQNELVPFDTSRVSSTDSQNFHGTLYCSSRLWNTKADTLTYYELPNAMSIWNVGQDMNKTLLSTSGLYDTQKLTVRDQYAMFLYGNNGYSTIEGNGSGKLLVVKDSYANCFVPFLTENYAQIGVIDLRNYNVSVKQLMEQEGYDQVLILYNFQSFISDTRLPYLNR